MRPLPRSSKPFRARGTFPEPDQWLGKPKEEGGGYQVIMRWDGGFVVESRDRSEEYFWGNGVDLLGGYEAMRSDGNLCLYDWADQPL